MWTFSFALRGNGARKILFDKPLLCLYLIESSEYPPGFVNFRTEIEGSFICLRSNLLYVSDDPYRPILLGLYQGNKGRVTQKFIPCYVLSTYWDRNSADYTVYFVQ